MVMVATIDNRFQQLPKNDEIQRCISPTAEYNAGISG